MIEILEALQAGGDIAMMAAVVFFMRMDRRILSIELFLKHKLKYGDQNMFTWLKKRFKEPTTFIGLGMLAQSAMILTKSNPQHIETVTSTIDQLSGPLAHGDTQGALMIALGGLLGFIMKEKAND